MPWPSLRTAMCVAVSVLAIALTGPAAAHGECGPPVPTCSLLRTAPIIFVGTLVSETDEGYHFRIEEGFKGVKEPYLDVLNVVFEGFSGFAGLGRRYLVFAGTFKFDDGTRAVLRDCSRNMQLVEYAQPALEQLRRERAGRRMSNVYGSLMTDPYDPDGGRLLPGVALTFQSEKATFKVTTDARASFAIDRMPAGSYSVLADLPPELELGQMILHEAPPPLELGGGICAEQTIVAVPKGRISGVVVGPDGAPRTSMLVRLFKADQYQPGARGPYALQINGKPFTFDRLLPGDYLVGFHADEDASVSNPFPTTLSPVIHLGAGQQMLIADIHLPAPVPTRKLRVVVDWNGHDRSLYDTPFLFRVDAGSLPDANYLEDYGVFDVDVVTSATYRIKGYAPCRSRRLDFLETDTAVFDGVDRSVSQVTLKFGTGGGCPTEVPK